MRQEDNKFGVGTIYYINLIKRFVIYSFDPRPCSRNKMLMFMIKKTLLEILIQDIFLGF